jgi:hypothetical protein
MALGRAGGGGELAKHADEIEKKTNKRRGSSTPH